MISGAEHVYGVTTIIVPYTVNGLDIRAGRITDREPATGGENHDVAGLVGMIDHNRSCGDGLHDVSCEGIVGFIFGLKDNVLISRVIPDTCGGGAHIY